MLGKTNNFGDYFLSETLKLGLTTFKKDEYHAKTNGWNIVKNIVEVTRYKAVDWSYDELF